VIKLITLNEKNPPLGQKKKGAMEKRFPANSKKKPVTLQEKKKKRDVSRRSGSLLRPLGKLDRSTT